MSVIDRADTKGLNTRADVAGAGRRAGSDERSRPRVAIAHDYLTQRGGAEKVVLSMARAFPDAVIYTTLFDPENTYPEFSDMDIRVSPLNKVGFLRRSHRAALPLLPAAASSMHIDADLVLVSSSGWAHGFRTSGTKLVYCYSPARWLYQAEAYLGESAGWKKRLALSVLTPFLRRWDRRAAASCEEYLAISHAVQGRITAAYDRPSTVLPAPATITVEPEPEVVDEVADWATDGFHLCISRLLAYKNVDKVIEAFRGTDRRLVVVGRGPEAERLRALKPDNVAMVSDLSDRQMAWLYRHCSAVVAASYEDFGLTPIEGAAYGKPAALLRWGGFLDTAVEHVTAEYFDEPEPEAIRAAVTRVEQRHWDSEKIADHVTRFSDDHFAAQLHEIVDRLAPDPKDIW
ncbi:glycosyltransferase [Williamsia herbipolensis]|uniref:Glycosyltransferase n=1 Tax=Williamsia herbipolensis TaxID=1603258 RepID=A0AAU4K5A4_9NOCA|nr:glycosyltransferase [Williamsia herbipolensis]